MTSLKYLNFVLSFAMVCTLLAGVNVVAFAADGELTDTVAVQKFYWDASKGGSGEHIYTIDEDEIDWYTSLSDWNYEGDAWKAPLMSDNPVYRLCNYNTGEHIWVADKGYADLLVEQGWTIEQGIAFYSADADGVPVYRLWNGTDGVGCHHYTTNEEEIIGMQLAGWKLEDVAFYGVKEEEPGEIEDVVIDNMSPSIGDTITATPVDADGEPVPGNYKYQWYREKDADEIAIKGATKAQYTVGTSDVGCTLYCAVTDENGDVYYSYSTNVVEKQTIEDLTILGMSGYADPEDLLPTIPVTGDQLYAVTDPVGAGDLVKYQWFRGTSAIVGATSATYTVTDADQGAILGVKIEPISDGSVDITVDTANTLVAACKNFADTTYSLNKTENIKAGDTLKLTVKDGITPLTLNTHYGVQWYLDEVSELTAIGGANANTLVVSPLYAGHTIIVAMQGIYTDGYYGEAALTANGPTIPVAVENVTADISVPEATVFNSVGVGNTMTVNLKEDYMTATYQWYKDGDPIVGATDDTYTFTTNDIDEATGSVYTCEVTGIGGCVGSDVAKANGGEKVKVTQQTTVNGFGVVNMSTLKAVTGGAVHVGDTLVASASPSTIDKNVKFVWYYADKNGDVQQKTGQTFTVTDEVGISSADDKPQIGVVAYINGNAGLANWVPAATKVGRSDAAAMAGPSYSVGNKCLEVATWSSMSQAADFSAGYNYLPVFDGDGFTNTMDDASEATLLLDVYRSLESNDVVISNNASDNTLDPTYKTYDVPEVGTYAHAYASPSIEGITYVWHTPETLAAAIEAGNPMQGKIGEGQHLQITDEMIGQNLICVAIAPNASKYKGSMEVSDPTAAVIPSSKTIVDMKIVAVDDTDPAPVIANATAYVAEKGTTTLEAGKDYYVFALDSEGNVIQYNSTSVKITFISSKYGKLNVADEGILASDTAHIAGGVITVKVAPDKKNYTGEAMSTTFTTVIPEP